MLDEWELISVDEGKGLHDSGTGGREGGEMHIEQTDVRRYDAESFRLANSVTRHRGFLAAVCRGTSA
jgi:hypothetical protein